MPENTQVKTSGISRSLLKWIGFVCLCIGSAGSILIKRGILHADILTNEELDPLIQPGGELFAWAVAAVVTMFICSIAVPIYARLFSEGWEKTSDRKKYMLRMAALALVSEFAYDWAMTGNAFNMAVQNPLWALLTAAVVLSVFQHFDQPGVAGTFMKVSAVLASVFWMLLLQVEMGVATVLLVACFSLLPKGKRWSILCAVAAALTQYTAPLGLLLTCFYNGAEGKAPRWLHYALYPAQFILFGLIASFM